MSKKWYVVHAYSGYEKNVSRALKERIDLSPHGEFFGEICRPQWKFRNFFSDSDNG